MAHLWTVHRKGERGLRLVPDRFDLLALLLPPVWIVWHGLWFSGVGLVVVLALAAEVSRWAVLPAWYGAALVLALEGGSVIRAELRLRGWREAATVEAATDAGAEELYLTGERA